MASVLHVTYDLDPRAGGLAKAVIDLAVAQAAAGIGVGMVVTHAAHHDISAAVAQLRAAGVEVEAVGPTTSKLHYHAGTRPAIAARIGQGKASVVHVHAVWEDAQHAAVGEARRAGVPVVWSPHGMLDPWSLRQSRWKKKIMLALRTRRDLNAAAAMHFTTRVERDLVAPLKLRPAAVVEPLGVDSAELADLPPKGAFRAKFPAVGDRRIVLFMSRVHYKKGLDLLIPAFAAAAGPQDVLVIAGPVAEGYQPEIDRLVAAAGIGGRVVQTGMLFGRDRLAPLVDATVFVLPSYQENFGIVVAEALAVGCPTIISDQVNIWPDIADARAGAVVPTDVARLTDTLRQWLADEALRHGAAERGRALAAERYNWPRIAQRWAGHYDRIAAGQPAAQP